MTTDMHNDDTRTRSVFGSGGTRRRSPGAGGHRRSRSFDRSDLGSFGDEGAKAKLGGGEGSPALNSHFSSVNETSQLPVDPPPNTRQWSSGNSHYNVDRPGTWAASPYPGSGAGTCVAGGGSVLQVLLQGHLKKKSVTGRINSWNDRYFVLRRGCLEYYTKQADAQANLEPKAHYDLHPGCTLSTTKEFRASGKALYTLRVNWPTPYDSDSAVRSGAEDDQDTNANSSPDGLPKPGSSVLPLPGIAINTPQQSPTHASLGGGESLWGGGEG
ncbi:unnamed protein product, partial [Discosporangium mesarthrocarpum]